MLLTCKCLNVSITISESGITSIDLMQLGLCGEDLRNDFFKNDIGAVELVEIRKEQPSLVHIGPTTDWLIHRCLICDCLTHAIHRERRLGTVLVTHDLMTDPAKIAALRESDGYSEVFKVVTYHHDNVLSDDTNSKLPGSVQTGALALQQALSEALHSRTTQIEEIVRAFTEKQYAELEQFKSTAHDEHKALLRILHKHANLLSEEAQLTNKETPVAAAVNIPSGLPPLPQPITAKAVAPKSAPTIRNRRPFSAAAAANVPQRNQMRGRNTPRQFAAQCSLDSEGLFDLEGMEEGAAPEDQSHSGEETEDDTDESGSHDEGIHIPRSRGGGGSQGQLLHLAKSLPVNVPAFHLATATDDFSGDPFAPERNQLAADIPRDHEHMDIAASIKALAQSVRGGASVFGDLPRPPRFSTQL